MLELSPKIQLGSLQGWNVLDRIAALLEGVAHKMLQDAIKYIKAKMQVNKCSILTDNHIQNYIYRDASLHELKASILSKDFS